MNTFVLGDIHGELTQLEDVFIKSNFNFRDDRLIFIGDVVDRGPEPFKCVDLLLKVQNLIIIAGNHDINFLDWASTGRDMFRGNYGSADTQAVWSLIEYEEREKYLKKYFYKMRPYFIFNNDVFVHGGFNINRPITEQSLHVLSWDRELWTYAMHSDKKIKTLEQFSKIYIGHTPTTIYEQTYPMYRNGVWNVDTGCGKGGLLTIMNVKTNDFWQA